MPIQKIDEHIEGEQVARVRALRLRRDADAHARALVALNDAARSGQNVMPKIVDAARAWATTGEISGVLREVFGKHQEVLVI